MKIWVKTPNFNAFHMLFCPIIAKWLLGFADIDFEASTDDEIDDNKIMFSFK